MHSRVLTAVMNAPIALFSQVDAGSLINRFSQDMELIDMELPVSLIHTVLMVFVLTAQTLVIVSTAKYAGVALPACGLAAYLTQKYYLRTSRALRLLDIEAKSLLFSHFLETLAGLVTIRAFRWTDSYSKTNADRINVSQRPAYLLLCVQRWLGLVLDLLVSAIAVILAAIAVKTRGQIDAGVMGLALLNVVGFSTTLKQLITNWTLLETSTGALSRVKSFTESVDSELADEKPQNFYQHVAAWPWHMLTSDPRPGIIFNEVTSSYTKFSKPVLNNVSIWIEPGQRIGVCGRSGSGKSSLLASLLRMTHIQSGSIVIDGIDISNLTPEQVRLRFNTLPQQPFLLHGTIRENIDPLDEHEFDAIVEALDLVGLRDLLLTDLGLEGGLDAPMPINVLSHGQSQLLCLARALVRRDRSDVLILDEATASVDAGTEALMQQLIADKFRGKTIIAVAHRLNTIIDYDRIAVLDDGVLVEWDRPSTLLQQDSYFRRLYKDSGASFE